MMINSRIKLAILIDAENIHHSSISEIDKITKDNSISVKRIYGDWTKNHLVQWKELLINHAIQPIQQFSYTSGKNSTDIAMVIDAMDLLYSNPHLDGFCIVTCDCDFTPLVMRLRSAGKIVYGMGYDKTSPAFRAACNQFVSLEPVSTQPVQQTPPSPKANSIQLNAISSNNPISKLIPNLEKAMATLEKSTGYISLSQLSQELRKQDKTFSLKNYGCASLKKLIEKIPQIELYKVNSDTRVRIVK